MMTNPPNIKQAENELDNVVNTPYKNNKDVTEIWKSATEELQAIKQDTLIPNLFLYSNSKLSNMLTKIKLNQKSNIEVMRGIYTNVYIQNLVDEGLLTTSDSLVLNSAHTLYHAGNKSLSLEQIWKTYHQTGKRPSKEALQETALSVTKLGNTYMYIDASKEVSKRKDIKSSRVKSIYGSIEVSKETGEKIYKGIPLLKFSPTLSISKNGKTTMGIYIEEEPILMQYERTVNHQIIGANPDYIDAGLQGLKNNNINTILFHHLNKRIEVLAHKGAHINNTLRYDTIFKEYELTNLDKKQAQRVKDTILKILDNLVADDTNPLTGYIENRQSRQRISVTLEVYSPKNPSN